MITNIEKKIGEEAKYKIKEKKVRPCKYCKQIKL